MCNAFLIVYFRHVDTTMDTSFITKQTLQHSFSPSYVVATMQIQLLPVTLLQLIIPCNTQTFPSRHADTFNLIMEFIHTQMLFEYAELVLFYHFCMANLLYYFFFKLIMVLDYYWQSGSMVSVFFFCQSKSTASLLHRLIGCIKLDMQDRLF